MTTLGYMEKRMMFARIEPSEVVRMFMIALVDYDRDMDPGWLLRNLRDLFMRWVRFIVGVYAGCGVEYRTIWMSGTLILHEAIKRQLRMIDVEGDEGDMRLVKRAKLHADLRIIWGLESAELQEYPGNAMRLLNWLTITMFLREPSEIDDAEKPFFDEVMAIPELRHEVFLECLAFL